MFDLLIRNGTVIDGSGTPGVVADVGVVGGRVTAVGRVGDAGAKVTLAATGKVVCPGFIDAHVHGDLPLLVDPYHEPAVRQGVTTYLVGQDGVAFAPAGPATMRHMRRYTAGFNGNFATPGKEWATVAEYLSLFDRRCAINVATLVPNGNVRMEAMGLADRPPTAAELAHMRRLVREGMEQGAVGLSSGLDYIPSLYADEAELTALCQEIAPFGGVYVTHMRGYNPAKAPAALAEVFAIGSGAGCGVHVSHFNCLAEQTIPLLEGQDVTFDLYPYLYGSTTLAMLTLPPELNAGGVDATLERLRTPAVRHELEAAFANPRFPIETIRLANLPCDEFRHLEGRGLVEAAEGRPLVKFVCDLLLATDLAAGCVIRHFAERQESDIVALTRHPAITAGSDGIFCGGFPHPRGTGTFAKYVGEFVRGGVWPLETAVAHLSHRTARRFGLRDRGLLKEGYAADVVVFDPAAVADRSTYADGKALAVGVEHVAVNGELVLHHGKRTVALPGRGLRRL
ncbi:MAG: amidohydrolase family protein [Gemmataceae bacterium]